MKFKQKAAKKIKQTTILKKALKKGINHSLFYLWLENSTNSKYKNLKKIWSNPHLLWKEIKNQNSEYSTEKWEEIYKIFQDEVKNYGIKRKKKKKVKVYFFDLEPSNLRELVECEYFSFISCSDDRIMTVDEEGESKELKLNKEATKLAGQKIYGNAVVFNKFNISL